MKICFLVDSIFSYGGVERVVSVIASNLALYHEVDVLCTIDKFSVNREMYNLNSKVNISINSKLRKVDTISKFSLGIGRKLNKKTGILNNKSLLPLLEKCYFPRETQINFIEYLNSKKYDVVIGVEGYYSLLLGIIRNNLDGNTIGWQHNSYYAYFNTPSKYNWKQDKLFETYIKNLDKYIVLTDEDKRAVEKAFSVKCERVYNPLSFTSSLKSKCTEKNVISVGRLVKDQKGFDLLIKAFASIAPKCKDWILQIVGDGEEKENLNNLIHSLNMNNQIKIQPFTNNIKDYYLNSSIFVSSSRWEGFGLVITEAMECGVPVVAFENSGPKEIINKNNENGILVPRNDIHALSAAILDLIKDEEKRKRISKNSIERAKDFSSENIIKQWNNILNSLEH
jgi:glycosyltransferase involved in cell wall biosynthesis